MFASYEPIPDIMVMQALQYLHGFDLTYRSGDGRLLGHGPPGRYVRTDKEVWDEYRGWLQRCHAYDADPDGWLAERRREGDAARRREREKQ
jgi:hypothetical protein